MPGNRQYTDEQIQFVLDNARELSVRQIIDAYKAKFHVEHFTKEQVKYLKTNYGLSPDFG